MRGPRRAARRCLEGLMQGNAFLAAAAVAFWFFLSLVPLLVLAGFLIGQVARAKGVDALIGPLVGVAPETAVDLVRRELQRLAGGGTTSVAPLGVVGFMWTASSGLHNLMDVVEQAAKATPRAWWKQRALSLGCVALGLGAACLAAWVLVQVSGFVSKGRTATSTEQVSEKPASSRAPAAKAGRPPTPGAHHQSRYALQRPADRAIAAAVVLVFGVLLLAAFYRIAVERVPTSRRGRPIWAGTWFAIVSWLVVSWAFGGYVSSLGNYALYYGSLAAVAVTLMWLYLTSLSLVVGAYVNAALCEP